jgi:heterodisulfide reductase subunit C
MSMLNIEDIQHKIANEQFELSKHAVDQSIIRQIRLHEIVDAIGSGQIIEDYPNDKYAPSCLICGLTKTGRTVHIQTSYPSRPLVKIVTVYEPDPKKWNSDFTVRRNNDE